jgi:hypothetical protein
VKNDRKRRKNNEETIKEKKKQLKANNVNKNQHNQANL